MLLMSCHGQGSDWSRWLQLLPPAASAALQRTTKLVQQQTAERAEDLPRYWLHHSVIDVPTDFVQQPPPHLITQEHAGLDMAHHSTPTSLQLPSPGMPLVSRFLAACTRSVQSCSSFGMDAVHPQACLPAAALGGTVSMPESVFMVLAAALAAQHVAEWIIPCRVMPATSASSAATLPGPSTQEQLRLHLGNPLCMPSEFAHTMVWDRLMGAALVNPEPHDNAGTEHMTSRTAMSSVTVGNLKLYVQRHYSQAAVGPGSSSGTSTAGMEAPLVTCSLTEPARQTNKQGSSPVLNIQQRGVAEWAAAHLAALMRGPSSKHLVGGCGCAMAHA